MIVVVVLRYELFVPYRVCDCCCVCVAVLTGFGVMLLLRVDSFVGRDACALVVLRDVDVS